MFRLNPFSPLPLKSQLGWIAVWVLAGIPLSASGQEAAAIWAALEEGTTKIIQDAEPSVVSIARISKRPAQAKETTGDRLPPGTRIEPALAPSEFGAGVVFSPADQPGKNFILTMYHVVKGGHIAGRPQDLTDELTIHTSRRRKAGVEIVAADPRSDLAVLQIREGESLKPEDLKPIRFAKSANYRKGQFVITLGNPYAIARDGSACAGLGMLSNIARQPKRESGRLNDWDATTLHHLGTLLQIDGQLNLGTSGGAVLNRRGELIGIITAMAALEGYEKSVGYAVPINDGIKRVIRELAHGYEVNYGLLGITLVTRRFPAGEQPTAVWVEAALPGSPASRAGLRSDDMLLAVNGTKVYTQEELMRKIAWLGPGEKARVELYRPSGGEMTKVVTLTKWPVQNDEEIIATRHRFAWNRIAVDYATARNDVFHQQYREAVLVTHIDQTSQYQPSQLRVGDFITHVDNRRVTSPEDFAEAVRGKKSDGVFRLLDNRLVTVPFDE